MSVCRLIERKGCDKVIKSLPEVVREIPNLIYLIVGEGPEKLELKKMVKEMGLNKYVLFVGSIPNQELVYYYNMCDLFILPTKRGIDRKDETFGIVFLEANACEKPVIGGRTGATNESIIDYKTGILVNPLSLKEISRTIISLLKNQRLANQIGKEGRKRVERDFRWSQIAKEYYRLLLNK